jgi:DNA-binding GntR family transcriptional regulator
MSTEGLSPYIAEQSLKGDRATVAEAELLRVEPNEPGIRFTATIFDSTGAPVAYTESFYVSARYEFQVTLRVTN